MEPPKIGEGVSGLRVGAVKAGFAVAAGAPSLARTTTERTRMDLATTERLLARTAAFWALQVRAMFAAAVLDGAG